VLRVAYKDAHQERFPPGEENSHFEMPECLSSNQTSPAVRSLVFKEWEKREQKLLADFHVSLAFYEEYVSKAKALMVGFDSTVSNNLC
jgi:hypothetical protein